MYKMIEKYQSLIKTVFKHNFWILTGQVVASLASLAIYFVFNKYSDQETVGLYKYIIAVGGIIGTFSLNGLNTAMVRSISKNQPESLEKYMALNFKWSALIPCIGIGIALYYFFNGALSIFYGVIIATIFTPCIQTYNLIFSYLHGKEQYRMISAYRSINAIIPAIFIVVAIITSHNPLVILLAYFAGSLASLLFIYKIHKTTSTTTIDTNGEVQQETISLARHLSVMGIFRFITENLDNIIIFQYLGAQQLALYTFATVIPDRIKGFAKNIYTIALPKFAKRHEAHAKKNIFHYIILIAIASCGIYILYYQAAPFIFNTLFSNYTESITYSRYYAVTLLFTTNIQTAFFNAHRMIRQKYIINIVFNTTKSILILTLAIMFGIWGVIYAQIIAQILLVLLMTGMIYYSK